MNFADYILDEALAFGRDRPAIAYNDQCMTYGELADWVARFAGLLAGIGARVGDRIALLMGNRPEHYVAFLGAARGGLICATMNVDYGLSEIAQMVRHAEPVCVIADALGAEKYRAVIAAEGLPAQPVLRVDVDPGAGNSLAACLQRADAVPAQSMSHGDPVLLAFSSGSSAMPKPILTGHGGEIFAARCFRNVWRFNSNDRVLVPLSLGWAYGIGTLSMPVLAAGGRIILLPRFRPRDACKAIQDHRATVMAGVTTIYRMIVDYASAQPDAPDLSSLRFAMTGGEKRDERVFQRFEAMAGIPVHDLYALSELRPAIGYDPILTPRPIEGAAGKPYPGVEVKLCAEDGSLVAQGQPGELYARSPNSFLGYFHQPELTAEQLSPDGWVKTGDLFRIDEQDFWHVIGRKAADIINRAGVKISATEIEDVVRTHPKVREAAVVAKPHPVYGEEVAICIVLVEGAQLSLEDVRAHCSGHFAELKLPTALLILGELPCNINGKVDRAALTRRLMEQ